MAGTGDKGCPDSSSDCIIGRYDVSYFTMPDDKHTESGMPELAGGGWLSAFKRIVFLKGPAHRIALGAAIGIFVAWLPIMGIQMAVAVPICLAVRANPIAGIPFIWVTNPLTAIPIYGSNYWVGRLIVGGPDFATFKKHWQAAVDVLNTEGTRSFLARLLVEGKRIAVPLWVGSVVVGAVLAVIGYYIVRQSVLSFRAGLDRLRHSSPDLETGDA